MSSSETTSERSNGVRCSATKRNGERCRAIAAFTDRVRHAATVNGLEELGLVRVMAGSEAEKLRDEGREARRRSLRDAVDANDPVLRDASLGSPENAASDQ